MTTPELIYNELETKINTEISVLNMQSDKISHILIQILEYIEDISKKNPALQLDKHQLALHLISNIINKYDISNEQKNKLIKLADNTIPFLIMATKKQLLIKKKVINNDNINIIIDNVYNDLKNLVQNNYTSESMSIRITEIVIQMMNIMMTYNVNGINKKLIIDSVLKKLLTNITDIFPNISEDNLSTLQLAINTVPDSIDTLIAASKGQYNINKLVTTGLVALILCCKKK